MKPVTFDSLCYRVDGEPVYINSGEFHYFRTPKADWRRRMQLFKEAGGNCLATYVPWIVHEPAEGEFAFGGDGYRDLEGFLRLAEEMGLYVVARPGPYQYSELRYAGLPVWLCDGYPQIRAHDINGKDFNAWSVSYLHPLFLEKVRAWFDQVVPIITKHTVTNGGAVAFVQLDNEMGGVHWWISGHDYNAEAMGNLIPSGFVGQPRDIARVAVFLATDDARYIVGQTIVVDGGTTSWMPFGDGFRKPMGCYFGKGYVSGLHE